MDFETRTPAGSELDRLTEATQLVRRTRLRLQELADRLRWLREQLSSGPGGPAASTHASAAAGHQAPRSLV